MSKLKKVRAVFYQTAGGNEPVREWLLDLDEESRRTVGKDIATAEFGWPVGMPVCRPMGDGLYEIRSKITGKRVARVLFAIYRRKMVLLHGFVKKSQKTPRQDLDLARTRAKEIAS